MERKGGKRGKVQERSAKKNQKSIFISIQKATKIKRKGKKLKRRHRKNEGKDRRKEKER